LKGDVCRKHGCSYCCISTEMPLTSRDIKRISDSGKRDFYHKGSHQLVNIHGRCFFLSENGDCTIYDIRPEGCRLYPLIMSMPSREPILDEECPHIDEFTIELEEVIRLNGLVNDLLEEEK
jgi:Fe-S-cluster containining protein